MCTFHYSSLFYLYVCLLFFLDGGFQHQFVVTFGNSPPASLDVHPHYENAVRDVLGAKKINTVDILESLKFLPKDKSRLNIPLCRMISRPIVRRALQTDVNKLKIDFVHSYRNWEKKIHFSITDEDGNFSFVILEVSQFWSDNWKCVK